MSAVAVRIGATFVSRQSPLSVASNTNLVIDDFVYDPAANSGHMLTRLTAGTVQYIGGQLSHQGAVTINTPAVAVGIRGGTVTITHGAPMAPKSPISTAG